MELEDAGTSEKEKRKVQTRQRSVRTAFDGHGGRNGRLNDDDGDDESGEGGDETRAGEDERRARSGGSVAAVRAA